VKKLLLGLVAVGLLAGCGAERESSAPPQQREETLAAAFRKTTDAGSSRMTFQARVQAAGETVDFSGKGLFDYRHARGRLTYDLGELAKVDPESEGIGRMTMVFDGLVFYMQIDGLRSELPRGKTWVKVDLAKAGGGAGAELGGVSQLSQSPAQQLQYLRASSKEIDEVGEETVRGVETTRYRAVVDLRKALELQVADAPPKFREAMRRDLEKSIEQTGVNEIPLDVWIDGEGLPRRMLLDFKVGEQGENAELQMTMDLFDFGVAVSVSTPPADEVLDISEFMDETQ
jgi:hypothetical protein